ncbi:electron transfer flavoprotein subunit alpha/FixB family protein [Haloarcula japonica]|uniref:Electron transfer flavor protein alpha subunit-like protein n=1 Tax=Haloarcula japonica (strain ATCC 49778 / DSM 6131 / JCM 7785 / NBRC 101032 / NCIMB 13157 / TR-1) TaxID=1227453 RepID=M0L2E8_HALJT|nr:electron transfer flavoprotein subunit alpha/FixB family protein [Haloarcula japonica]EMA27757.1 electron transfer flavor protein alpha subunit-like protein [Haloarcula japonica DSM 6131]
MILSFVEHAGGSPEEPSLEALTLARELATATDAPLEVVAFGTEASALGDTLRAYGVETVHRVADDRLDTYAPEAWAESVAQLLDATDPEAVVAPGTDRGQEVLAHVGAKCDLPMAANCLDVELSEVYELSRQRWGGSLVEHARLDSDTKLLTAAPHEFSPETAVEAADTSVQPFEPTLDESAFRVSVDRVEESDESGVSLGEARVVVGGGRGIGGPEDYDKLETLADSLSGTVGASRAAVNEGWRPHDDQIGQTGTKISPDLYVACGISGAVQHMVGCKGADNILAVNTDPEAAIMQKADYAVVGDLHEVVPELNNALADER